MQSSLSNSDINWKTLVDQISSPSNERLVQYLQEFKARKISISDVADLSGNAGQ